MCRSEFWGRPFILAKFHWIGEITCTVCSRPAWCTHGHTLKHSEFNHFAFKNFNTTHETRKGKTNYCEAVYLLSKISKRRLSSRGTQYVFLVQCSSDISEPKYTRNSRQPNTRIRVWIYAYTRIRIRTYAYVLIRVCLISMYELTCWFFFC